MLRQLFISGVVAACNMEVIDRNAKKMMPLRALSFRRAWSNTFDAARFTRIHLNSIR